MIYIEIDPNVRIQRNHTYASLDDITWHEDGRPDHQQTLDPGDEVTVYEREAGWHCMATVASIGVRSKKHTFVELIVPWGATFKSCRGDADFDPEWAKWLAAHHPEFEVPPEPDPQVVNQEWLDDLNNTKAVEGPIQILSWRDD